MHYLLDTKTPMITAMLQADNPDRVLELMERAKAGGADALGMQFCRMKSEHQTKEVYSRLIKSASTYPTYVTNYRQGYNEKKTDDELAAELLMLAECGATFCDVMGDMFDIQPDQMATDESAISKQMALIKDIHERGSKVIMSSHVCKFIPIERIVRIANEQVRRGADVVKIVVGAENSEEEIENLRAIELLGRTLPVPFLILSSGKCDILRRIGGRYGCAMYLCVVEHDELSTRAQPLLGHIKSLENIFSSIDAVK